MNHRSVSRTFSLIAIVFGTYAHAQSQPADPSAVSKIFAESGGINVAAGIRLWGNYWDIPQFDIVPVNSPQAPGGVVIQDTVTTHRSAFKVVPVPFLGVRVGNFIGSASYFIRTDYDAQTPQLPDVSREELDVNLGYSVLPASSDASLVISLGYKGVKVNTTTIDSIVQQVTTKTKINAGLIGVSGSAPLADNWRLYGNVAYGIARQDNNFPAALSGLEANRNLDGEYRLAEVGLSYLFFRGGEGQAIRSATVSLGYRAHIYTIKSYSFYTRNSLGEVIATDKRDIDSTTQGPILSLNASF